ncbi:MAG: DUF5916 domain-containing protein [Chitinophagaceae bacterium]
MRVLLFMFFFFLLSFELIAQDADVFKPDSIKKSLRAIPFSGFIKVDGHLSESEWTLSRNEVQFIQIEPKQGLSSQFPTEINILYNKQFLYFGVKCLDPIGKKAIRSTDFKRDFNTRSHDHIALTFDGFNDHRNAMALFTNAFGVQRDQLVFDDTFTDLDWDGLWKVRTSRNDSGWIAEIAIPWQTLRYPKTKDSIQQWGFNIYRTRRMTNEVSAFSPYPRNFSFTRMDYAGLLTALKPPPPRPNIRVQPYLLVTNDAYKNMDRNPASVTKIRSGGEIKWAVNPNTILDLTYNTDFAQADADRQVNNLTRFSVFFPERRQFFLENASLFGIGVSPNQDMSGGNMRIQPFFSRKIGLDDYGNPLPIEAGGRLVYRSGKRNMGVMLMRQRSTSSSLASNFMVARYSENIGRQSRIGGLMTVRNDVNHSNVVGAIDGFFRLGEKHSISAMLSNSNSGTRNGVSGYTQYYYTSNQWKFWWTQSLVTKNYEPEMGFVSRNDVIGTTPGIFNYYRGKYLPFKKWIRASEPGVMMEIYHQASTGVLIERQVMINPLWFNFQKGGFLGYIVTPAYQNLTEEFQPLGIRIEPGAYNYLRHTIYYSTDPSKFISTSMNYETGTYFNGNLDTKVISVAFAPIPNIYLQSQFSRNKFRDVGVGKENTTADLYSITGRFAFNPRLQLIGFYQMNSSTKQENYNIRLSWEYRPLSYIYLVFNKRAFDNSNNMRAAESHSIFKFSYLKQI